VPTQLAPDHPNPDFERRFRDISKGVRELLYNKPADKPPDD
jgi:hypothetical protein